jgi:regulator of protease activity HflC (stomatin/prohibitin superfamily)
MIRLALSAVLFVAAIFLWKLLGKKGTARKYVDHETKREIVYPNTFYIPVRIGCIILFLVAVLLILSTSFVIIGPNETGHLTKIFGFKSLPEGKIIATGGERGKQTRLIAPGFHFEFLLNVIYKVERKHDIVIESGFCGKITALDGQPLPEEEVYAPEWPEQEFTKMLGADYFLKNGGRKGPQISVLKPGNYKINQYLFQIEPREKVTTVEQGFVGVVKSNAQQVPFVQQEVDKLNTRAISTLSSTVVPKSYRGVWKEVLPAGQYYLNKDVFTVIPIDIRVQTWAYTGGFIKRYIDLQVDQDGGIKQMPRQENIPIPKDAADMAIIVRIEGWEIPLDTRILVQVEPEKAPYVVASVGNIDEIENDILTPTYRSVVRNVCGKQGRKVLELIYNRDELEAAVEKDMIPEGEKAFITIKEVRFGEPAFPPELMLARIREQLAEQLKQTFEKEKLAQEERIKTEKAREEANQQAILMAAQIKKQAAEFEKESAKLQGEGEKLRLEQIAQGQSAQSQVLGQDRVLQLAMLQAILDSAKQNPEIVKVPSVLVQGTGGGLEGAAAILGASNLTQSFIKIKDTEQQGQKTDVRK